MIKKIVGLATAVAAALTLVACGNSAAHEDAPPTSTSRIHDVTGEEVTSMPDGYRNIVTFCDHGNRVYEASSGPSSATTKVSTIAVVPNDPSCPKS